MMLQRNSSVAKNAYVCTVCPASGSDVKINISCMGLLRRQHTSQPSVCLISQQDIHNQALRRDQLERCLRFCRQDVLFWLPSIPNQLPSTRRISLLKGTKHRCLRLRTTTNHPQIEDPATLADHRSCQHRDVQHGPANLQERPAELRTKKSRGLSTQPSDTSFDRKFPA